MERIEAVRTWLKMHRKEWPIICQRTGLRLSWVEQFAYGRIKTPGAHNYLIIEAYIRTRNA